MRYKIDTVEIRSENSAKPISQPSRKLIEWLSQMEPVDYALDYGCGKLRYTAYLAARSKHLTLVDSRVQLDRVQVLGREATTIRQFSAARWPHVKILDVDEFQTDSHRYDFALCANVLSAIPEEATRDKLLVTIRSVLSDRGKCLFVNQYSNSYFREIVRSGKAIPHLDGWLLSTSRGTFYYGALGKEQISTLLYKQGYSVVESWKHGQSAYVLAGNKVPK